MSNDDNIRPLDQHLRRLREEGFRKDIEPHHIQQPFNVHEQFEADLKTFEEVLREEQPAGKPIIPANAQAFINSLQERYRYLHEQCMDAHRTFLDKADQCLKTSERLKQEFIDFENQVYERYHYQARVHNFLIEVTRQVELHVLPSAEKPVTNR